MDAITMIVVYIFIALATFLFSLKSKQAGAWMTVVASTVLLTVLLIAGDGLGDSITFLGLSLTVTPMGWFFSVIMAVVYSMVSFFNPYWMKKMLHPAGYNFLYILSLTATIGVFFSNHFITLFIFWEIVVWSSMFIVPMGKSRISSVAYYAMSTLGSFAMLYAILMLNASYGSFDIKTVLTAVGQEPDKAVVAFLLILVAGLVKLGVFPFHIWLPMAHGKAPDTFSPILSGGLVKLGGFVAILVVTVLPIGKVLSGSVQILGQPILIYAMMLLGAVSMVVGTLMAIKQDDAKVLLAYSSVANAGYILVGILMADSLGMSGALMHIMAHAFASAAAFLSIAAVSYRTGTTKMSELGGMIHKMPITYLTYLISIISMAGIPPMAGFISKWMLFQALAKHGLFIIAGTAFFGSVGSFLYVFRPLSAVFLGQLKPEHEDVKEAPPVMLIPMIGLSLITLFYGVVPNIAVNYVGKILTSLGIQGLATDGLIIEGSNGAINPTLITTIFAIGFAVALLIFLKYPKSKKVGLMDTYTGGEFIYTPELFHYAGNFYAPFERLYEKHPSIVDLYSGLVQRVRDLGEWIQYTVFNYVASNGVMLIVVTLILIMWGEKI